MILPVIMAGGSGSRLWPLSRQQFPKQFLTLLGNNSMLQTTAQRLKGIEHAPALVICNEEHRFSVAEQFRANAIKTSGIILEPVGRNTAPAIALAAMQAIDNGDDPLLLVLAADHVIKDEAAFCASVEKAMPFAQADKLVTFGIVPTAPETGYGYIKRGDVHGDNAGFSVAQFVEKPNLETAQDYLTSGEYYWNSGMFLFKASVYLAELKTHRPDIYSACEQAMSATQVDLDFIRVDKAAFEACPDDSIDYAVMEQTSQAVVVPMDCGWSDVGSWSALWEVSDKDEHGNACRGDVINLNTRNTYVHTTEKLVTTIGLDDVVVVETKDAILVAKQSEVQEVKNIVAQLKAEERSEWQHHREVYRPWGKYDSIDNGDRFQVKRITVKPGEKLSIQMHHHRAEHWIVVTGTAKVSNGDKELLLTENQSTYIPVGVIHALENPGKVPLELIEVQSGSYLGEDDIVRFEDRYGRVN
ncbi:mannose-1-phosphate guanylyltransferase/mannose-6-phosphate isomerase [Shewanella insulae]|uniref:mannose-1-phosphate guanylyltransferase/mannose-6-phosphate isomerase n=1 Tax=Shewanella insulae TaxID=2681496 RepID=UPI00247FA66C|nr:mannose-1-phosphate guanylyltransferase/mannose-6-phosphate isomerase [Shewanella insulae]